MELLIRENVSVALAGSGCRVCRKKVRAINLHNDPSETRRTPGRESRRGTTADANYRFRHSCRRTLCSSRNILCKPLCGVVYLDLTAFELRPQQIVRGLTQHQVEANTDEDHHQYNGYDTDKEIRHQEAIAHSPDEFSHKRPNQCDAKKNKKEDEENREQS